MVNQCGNAWGCGFLHAVRACMLSCQRYLLFLYTGITIGSTHLCVSPLCPFLLHFPADVPFLDRPAIHFALHLLSHLPHKQNMPPFLSFFYPRHDHMKQLHLQYYPIRFYGQPRSSIDSALEVLYMHCLYFSFYSV